MTLIFIHIPKTAGTTVCDVLRRQFSPDECWDHIYPNRLQATSEQVPEPSEAIKCVFGHYSFGIHRKFSEPHLYFTMLRDPVERIISMYCYHKSKTNQMWVRDATLPEFLERHPAATNGQTKLIGGQGQPVDLDKAKSNLRRFAAVGITERFEESMRLFKRSFGWTQTTWRPMNVSRGRLRRRDILPETIRAIEKHNEHDAELYLLAKELLNERLEVSISHAS